MSEIIIIGVLAVIGIFVYCKHIAKKVIVQQTTRTRSFEGNSADGGRVKVVGNQLIVDWNVIADVDMSGRFPTTMPLSTENVTSFSKKKDFGPQESNLELHDHNVLFYH